MIVKEKKENGWKDPQCNRKTWVLTKEIKEIKNIFKI